MSKKVGKGQGESEVFPSKRQLAAFKNSIPRFKPIDLRPLLREARNKTGSAKSAGAELVRSVRAETENQIGEILTALNVSRTRADSWERAFFLLAHSFLGVGHFRLGVSRENRNAANWTPTQDRLLAERVERLLAEGRTISVAFVEIAADDSSAETFPYRPMKRYSNGYGDGKDAVTKRRAQALKQRYRLIKMRMKRAGLSRMIAPGLGSDIEEYLAYLDKLDRPLG